MDWNLEMLAASADEVIAKLMAARLRQQAQQVEDLLEAVLDGRIQFDSHRGDFDLNHAPVLQAFLAAGGE